MPLPDTYIIKHFVVIKNRKSIGHRKHTQSNYEKHLAFYDTSQVCDNPADIITAHVVQSKHVFKIF